MRCVTRPSPCWGVSHQPGLEGSQRQARVRGPEAVAPLPLWSPAQAQRRLQPCAHVEPIGLGKGQPTASTRHQARSVARSGIRRGPRQLFLSRAAADGTACRVAEVSQKKKSSKVKVYMTTLSLLTCLVYPEL